jgi:hypothetical protein
MGRRYHFRTSSSLRHCRQVTAVPLQDPGSHPFALNAESDWRLIVLAVRSRIKTAYEIQDSEKSAIAICVSPNEEYWPAEDNKPWPITDSRPRSMRCGEYFVISSTCRVSQKRMLFTLREAVAHAVRLHEAAIETRRLERGQVLDPQDEAALLSAFEDI